jgi:pyrrolysine biosynthesis protein PylD
MTRLKASDVEHIPVSLSGYEAELRSRTGHGLKGLACNAVGVEKQEMNGVLPRVRARVVPLTWGEGLIPGFAAAVSAVLNWIGLAASTTRNANLAGIAEAVQEKCELVFFSDDDDFLVWHLDRRRTVHNAMATGKGFAAGLDLMAGGVRQRRALVMGCGAVGASAALELNRRGAHVTLYDRMPERCDHLKTGMIRTGPGDVLIAENLEASLREADCIIDATPAADLIDADRIGPDTLVSAPGMPLGLTDAAVKKIGRRLLHDPLQIGVATMAVQALAEMPLRIHRPENLRTR